MRYVSTRGGAKPQAFTEILLEGLAPDGGLFLPEEFPKFSPADLSAMRGTGYRELAFAILSKFADDIPPGDLKRLVDATYTKKIFGSDDITPVKKLESGVYLLGLSNGPSLAFKDVALQLLGNLLEYALGKLGRRLNVLGATSGDTGSSAEYALRGKENVQVFMLSPQGRMSPFQAAQMYSLQDANIFNIAVRGVFDDCQDIVKAISGDFAFKARHRIGAVNSINWARVAAHAEVKATSSPSMDISKSSNFERYAYDLVGRDPFRLKSLWAELDANGVFALAGTEIFRHVADTGFVSGSSTHADRLTTIRRVWKDYGVMIDPHTADGIKVGLEHREEGVPLVCMETAQPAKFAETIREALGREPSRPAGFENLEKLPQRVEAMDADVGKVKHYIAGITSRSV